MRIRPDVEAYIVTLSSTCIRLNGKLLPAGAIHPVRIQADSKCEAERQAREIGATLGLTYSLRVEAVDGRR